MAGPFSNAIAVSEQPRYGGTFVVAMASDTETLNPDITTSVYAIQMGGLLSNNLLRYDENYKPYPDLAQSWDVAPDGLTYTFHLVRNATWHDGYPFTSADVKYTYTQVLSKYQAKLTAGLRNLASLDTPDNYTAIFRMSKPYTPLLYLLGVTVAVILPAHLYSGTDPMTNKYNFAPVGTGPYKFVEWKRGEYVKLVRNDKFWKAEGNYLDQVIFKIIPDGNTRVIALQTGNINYLWYYTLSYSAAPALMKDSNLIYTFDHVDPASDIVQAFLNLRNPILNNTDVRHALNYAINKTELIDKVAFGLGKEAVGPIPSSYGPTIFNPNLPVYPYDVSKANQLLDKAGYPKQANGTRFSLELTWIVENTPLGRAAELIKSQLALVGVNINFKPTDRTAVLDAVFNRWKYDMFIQSMGTSPLPDAGVTRNYLASNIGHNTFSNAAAYNNPTADALWADAATTTDPAKRTQDFYRVQEIIVQDMPHLWFWEVKSIAIWSKDFAGLHIAKTNYGIYNLQDTYWLKGTMASPQNVQNAGEPFPWLSVGLAAAAAIVIITGVLMLRKRKRAEPEEAKT